MEINEIKEFIIRADERNRELIGRRDELQAGIMRAEDARDRKTKARVVLQEVAQLSQARLKKKVESLVTSAISSVFVDRDLNFELVFLQKANRIEVLPVVMERNHQQIPKDDMGGGIIDIIAFALRVVLWSMQKPRSRATFVLDEPMKNVSTGRYRKKAVEMFAEISEKLNLQLIIVTHIDELSETADRIYRVVYDGEKSKVILEKETSYGEESKEKEEKASTQTRRVRRVKPKHHKRIRAG